MRFLKFDKPKAFYIYNFLNILIIIDVVGLIYTLVGDPSGTFKYYFLPYDLFVCILLLAEFFIKLKMSTGSKKLFLKKNWIDLAASIPFDVMLGILGLSSLRLIRLVRIFKMLRMASMLKKHLRILSMFLKSRSLDKILSYILITIVIFTLIFNSIDPKMDVFQSFWFVITTVTTVGYGNVIPSTFASKVISLLLVIFGVFIFSTITGAISSYFTEKVLHVNDVTIEDTFEMMLDEKVNGVNDELKAIQDDLKLTRKENEELKKEIIELKEIMNK